MNKLHACHWKCDSISFSSYYPTHLSFLLSNLCRQCIQGHYSPPCNHSAFFISSISIFELLLSSIVPETGGTSKNQFLLQKPSLVRDKLMNWNVSSHVPYFYKVMQTVHLHHSPQTTFRTVINVYLLIANLRNLFSALILLACSSVHSLELFFSPFIFIPTLSWISC